MSNSLNLIRFQADSFLGIDSDSPIVLDFTEANAKSENITLLEGEQGSRKTSTITALRFALADSLEVEQSKLVNLKDHRIALSLDFEAGGYTYRVRATKSRFALDKFIPAENAWLPINEPKTYLKHLVGTIGTSPMYLKEAEGKEQIRRFRKSFGASGGVDEQEAKLLSGIAEASEARKEANKNYLRIKAALDSDDLFINYEESRLEYSRVQSLDDYRNALNTAAENKTKYEHGQMRVTSLENEEKERMEKIAELEAQLEKARGKLAQTQGKIETGKQWLKENISMVDDFHVAQQDYEAANRFVLQQERWKALLQQEREMHDFEELIQGFDATKDTLRTHLLELTNSYKPDIEGLEIKVSTELTDTQEGIFYKGLALAQLSESELWDLYMRVWRLKQVQLVFIENLSSLGSHAINTLNHLAESGVKIFASQVRRGQDKISISFTDKIV